MTKKYDNDYIIKRLINSALFVLVIFILLIVRLLYFGIVKKDEFEESAEKQNDFYLSVLPDRGFIYDRNLEPLTYRKVKKTVFITTYALRLERMSNIKNSNSICGFLINKLDYSEEKIDSIIENTTKNVIEIPIPDNKIDEIIGDNNLVKGIYIEDKHYRNDDNNYLSHVIGLMPENGKGQGLENAYNDTLSVDENINNIKLAIDGRYRFTPILQGAPAIKRNKVRTNSIKLTIDYNIQKEVEETFDKYLNNKDRKGAVIVTEVKTGDILAMVSRPNLYLKNMSRGDSDYKNRAINFTYPPASLFKIVVLIAALESEMLNIEEKFNCIGYEIVNGRPFNCHANHGEIDIKEALYNSCNSVFINLGKRVGAKKIMKVAQRVGFGELIDIGLQSNITGTLPKEDEWYGRAIGNISIGQGSIEVTPLHISNFMTIIANEGTKKPLTLVDELVTENGITVKKIARDDNERVIEAEHAKILKEMLNLVVDYGTASDNVDLSEYGGAAGKTGTAQWNNSTVGWFSGYFPRDNPKYTITVSLENSISGDAGSIFNAIAEETIKLEK